MLVGEAVGVAVRVLCDVAACGLVAKPFAYVSLGGAGALGDLLEVSGPAPAIALVEAEFLAEDDGGVLITARMSRTAGPMTASSLASAIDAVVASDLFSGGVRRSSIALAGKLSGAREATAGPA